jgi:diguanylate cyclase (GGDEF)-like protein
MHLPTRIHVMPRPRSGSGGRPPRTTVLVRRFALYVGIGILIAAGGMFWFVRRSTVQHAVSLATFHSRFIAETVLRDQLRESDFDGPVGPDRRVQLDRLFRRDVLVAGAMRVKLYGRDRHVTYSNDHELIGGAADDDDDGVPDALAGALTSDVSHLADEGGGGPNPQVLESYAPVRLSGVGRPVGVFELYQTYDRIAGTASGIFLPIVGFTSLILLGFYVLLFRGYVRAIEHSGQQDRLTGLGNRALLEEGLTRALHRSDADRTVTALLYIDLNDFKLVNDSLGHATGDEVLRQVARRLQASTPPGALLARQGGDEFLLLLPDLGTHHDDRSREAAMSDVRAVASGIAAQFEQPFAVGDAEFQVGAAIGASLYPLQATSAEELHRFADHAMYRAKSRREHFAFYEPAQENPLQPLERAAGLRRALRENALELHYQPIYRVRDRSVLGVEALVRWRAPTGELISPAEFIPVAEHTGLIEPIGDWVAHELCRQATIWKDLGLHPNFGLNVSPRQLRRPNFAADLAAVVASYGLAPERFVIELTESAWTGNAKTSTVPEELRAHGFKLAIDDFGTGHSNLARLRDLPVDIIKIDRSFLPAVPEQPQACAVVEGIAQLALACECDIVFEGVETAAQLEFLDALGIRLIQGFHLTRPLPHEQATKLLAESMSADRRTPGAAPVALVA